MSEVKKVENKNKKPSKVGVFFSNIGKRFKETFAELKKVTWPDFAGLFVFIFNFFNFAHYNNL